MCVPVEIKKTNATFSAQVLRLTRNCRSDQDWNRCRAALRPNLTQFLQCVLHPPRLAIRRDRAGKMSCVTVDFDSSKDHSFSTIPVGLLRDFLHPDPGFLP